MLSQLPTTNRRSDLEPADFVYATARHKVLYEVEFPETQQGGDRKSSRHNGELKTEADRFTKTAADHRKEWMRLKGPPRLSGQVDQKVDAMGRLWAHRPEGGLSLAVRKMPTISAT